jgi:hypothetical protein
MASTAVGVVSSYLARGWPADGFTVVTVIVAMQGSRATTTAHG